MKMDSEFQNDSLIILKSIKKKDRTWPVFEIWLPPMSSGNSKPHWTAVWRSGLKIISLHGIEDVILHPKRPRATL